jgi:hypothetical protein
MSYYPWAWVTDLKCYINKSDNIFYDLFNLIDLIDLLCLMPLSAIFQLYHGERRHTM